ncbi:MAG TPA: hypothetical protein VII94_00900 [Candidatus Saccharimonadales bacterium]
MKKDPIKTLIRIRDICNDPDVNARDPKCAFGEIEWNCRHALEDHHTPRSDIVIESSKVTVITGRSESGDDYGPWVFDRAPSDEQLESFLREECAGDFCEDDKGPGIFGSYVHININEVEIFKV